MRGPVTGGAGIWSSVGQPPKELVLANGCDQSSAASHRLKTKTTKCLG